MPARPLPSQSEKGAHECHCHLNCDADGNGKKIRVDTDPACELYCTQSRCKCYPDDPCSRPDVQPR